MSVLEASQSYILRPCFQKTNKQTTKNTEDCLSDKLEKLR